MTDALHPAAEIPPAASGKIVPFTLCGQIDTPAA